MRSFDLYGRMSALVVVMLAGLAFFSWKMASDYMRRPMVQMPPVPVAQWPDASVAVPVEAWQNVQAERGAPSPPPDALSARFRLAGTYYSSQHGGQIAIIDLVADKTQTLVTEKSFLGDYLVAVIERDRVILERDGLREELTLSFSTQTAGRQAEASRQAVFVPEGVQGPFGEQIGENRWVLRKDALMDYYHEMLDDPERIAHIYISLKPDYSADRKILGYELDMTGEQAFFQSVGLQQGDKIRKVNSMNMTSRQRGEYFLREFVNQRLSAVVLDIERNGEERKLIYLIR